MIVSVVLALRKYRSGYETRLQQEMLGKPYRQCQLSTFSRKAANIAGERWQVI